MHTISTPLISSETSLFVSSGRHQLHLKRFCGREGGAPVFLVHGSMENGRIFYSDSGKGLAPWLASKGFDVFVADLRGRGESTPPVRADADWGLREILEEDFSAMLAEIVRIKGQAPQHWMAHSWGGVLQLAYLARWQCPAPVASLCFFGVKRRIGTWSPKKFLMIDAAWGGLGAVISRLYGYLPAEKWGMGADNESTRTYQETYKWVMGKAWLDHQDGFDYAAALKKQALPPALYITGADDKIIGNPIDVHRLMLETGVDQPNRLVVAGKASGFMHDYGHVDLLTHQDAPSDVFPMVEAWMRKQSQRKI